MGGLNYDYFPNIAENLILGTGPANGLHLMYESIAKHFVQKTPFELTVKYELKNPIDPIFHAFRTLVYRAYYKVRCLGIQKDINLFKVTIRPMSWAMIYSDTVQQRYAQCVHNFKTQVAFLLDEVKKTREYGTQTEEYIFRLYEEAESVKDLDYPLNEAEKDVKVLGEMQQEEDLLMGLTSPNESHTNFMKHLDAED